MHNSLCKSRSEGSTGARPLHNWAAPASGHHSVRMELPRFGDRNFIPSGNDLARLLSPVSFATALRRTKRKCVLVRLSRL